MKERDRLLYMFRKQKTSELYKTYCSYRNKVQRNIKQAKADYLSNKMEENKHNSRKLWQQIKSLGYNTKHKSSTIST